MDTTPNKRGASANDADGKPQDDMWSPAQAERLVDSAIITPRVVDERAFDELSGTLSELIRESIRRGSVLRDATADAERFAAEARQHESTLRKNIEQGAKLGAALGERAARAEQAARALESAEAIAKRVDEVIDERLRAGEERLESRLAAINERIEARLLALEAVERRVSEAETRASEVDNALAQRVDQALDACNEMVEKADQARDALDTQLAGVLAQIDRQRADLEQTIAPVREITDRATRILGIDPDNPDEGSTIDRLADEAAAAEDRLSKHAERIGNLTERADTCRSDLERSLDDAAKRIDEIDERRTAIEGPLAEQASRLSVLTPDLLDRFERAGREIGSLLETVAEAEGRARRARDELASHAGQIDALTRGAKRAVQQQAEEAGAWLRGLMPRTSERAQAIGTAPTVRPPSPPSARVKATKLATPVTPAPSGIEPKPVLQRPAKAIDAHEFDASHPVIPVRER